MNKRISFLTLILILSLSSGAQISSSTLSKSVVKVIVVIGNRANVCTGFVWKNPDQVVTSLHAMNPASSEIRILYLNNTWRAAKIKQILQKADIVLLELLPGLHAPDGVIPLLYFNGQMIAEDTDVKALGYNNGASGISTRSMKKGWVDPETLNHLVPPKDKEVLKKIGFPALDLPIIYLEGSLLPGFSGSPVFDPQSKLIGIGDGGLEKGASNVSWIIPAKFLPELENSTLTTLPASLTEISQLFSASVNVDISAVIDTPEMEENQSQEGSEQARLFSASFSLDELNETQDSIQHDNDSLEEPEETAEDDGEAEASESVELSAEQIQQPQAVSIIAGMNEYLPVKSDDFEFYMTKNRSLLEMFETTDDPENLIKFVAGLKTFNLDMDFENLRFDIYEDINYGVVLAVPEGEVFGYDKESGMFKVNFYENPNVSLLFTGMTEDNSQTTIEDELDETFEWLSDWMADYWKVKSFSIDLDYTYLLPYDAERQIAYVLLKSEPVLDSVSGGYNTIFLYVTLLMKQEKSFISIASYKMTNEKLNFVQQNGLNCQNKDFLSDDCKYFESLIKVFCAAHLTTFAY